MLRYEASIPIALFMRLFGFFTTLENAPESHFSFRMIEKSVAALATFLPCYLFTIILAPYFKKIAKNKSIKAFVDGITSAVIGALAGAVIIIAKSAIIDVPTLLISLATIGILIYFKKMQEPYIIILAAILGFVIKMIK